MQSMYVYHDTEYLQVKSQRTQYYNYIYVYACIHNIIIIFKGLQDNSYLLNNFHALFQLHSTQRMENINTNCIQSS